MSHSIVCYLPSSGHLDIYRKKRRKKTKFIIKVNFLTLNMKIDKMKKMKNFQRISDGYYIHNLARMMILKWKKQIMKKKNHVYKMDFSYDYNEARYVALFCMYIFIFQYIHIYMYTYVNIFFMNSIKYKYDMISFMNRNIYAYIYIYICI
jgi:hypothetical protein